jgi:hypothetical protein
MLITSTMNNQVVEYIRWSANLSGIIPLIFYLRFISNFPKQNHFVAAIIILSGCTDALSLLTRLSIIPNLFEILQFILINLFYLELVYKKKSEPVILVGVGIYIAVLIYSVLAQGFQQYYTALWCTGALITLIHSFFYVFNIPKMVIERYFDSNLLSNMIFNAAFFLYFFVALVMFFLFDSVAKNKDLISIKAFWSIHNAFAIIKNMGFALAFYYTGKRQIYMTTEQLERIARELDKEQNIR